MYRRAGAGNEEKRGSDLIMMGLMHARDSTEVSSRIDRPGAQKGIQPLGWMAACLHALLDGAAVSHQQLEAPGHGERRGGLISSLCSSPSSLIFAPLLFLSPYSDQ